MCEKNRFVVFSQRTMGALARFFNIKAIRGNRASRSTNAFRWGEIMVKGESVKVRVTPRFFVFILLCILAFSIVRYNARQTRIDEMAIELSNLRESLYDESIREGELRIDLANAGTEEFIERTARHEYGYLMPGEILYKVSNLPSQFYADTGLGE